MSWIAVHSSVFGYKLRSFRKTINRPETESLGILILLWLWASENVNEDGMLMYADKEDIASFLASHLEEDMDAMSIVDALIECGLIDEYDGNLFVHDWYDWQQPVYAIKERREKERNRQRKYRNQPQDELQVVIPVQETLSDEFEVKTKKKKEKVAYSELVKMYPEQHQKLIDKYGEAFTEKLIYELDIYKGNAKKQYKDDYRAILSWVVEKCEKKYPNLKPQPTRSTGENPFAGYI